MLKFTQGDMFEASADIRINTVNCVGVMGAGVALAFKQRYPEMFRAYERDCKDGQVKPGRMHVWKSLSGDWIVNFPTKRDWREPSRYEDIDAGLDDLRHYLDTVGPVTVALPALGCGHGGLDWVRVSDMIREKLDGVDADVMVFEPAASRQAGRMAAEAPTEDVRRDAEKLGYQLIEKKHLSMPELSTPVYVFGKRELLSRKWIALLPSRVPGEREIQALRAIATQLARSKNRTTIALIYGTRASEEVAQLFTSEGIDTVLLLPFGILSRKAVAKQPPGRDWESPTLISAVPANAKWSRQLFAQTMDMLRANAAAMLLSDPEPDWLTNRGLGKWARTPISYIRYETTSPHMRETLAGVNAKPIGRRGEDGAPNIEHLRSSSNHELSSDVAGSKAAPQSEHPESTSIEHKSLNGQSPSDVLAINLGELSEVRKRELFDVLLRLNTRRLDMTVTLPRDVNAADLVRLMELGFSQLEREQA